MTQDQQLKEKRIEGGNGIHILTPITDEEGHEIGAYENDGKEDGVYVFVTNDSGDSVFFLHTNSVARACAAIVAYAQALKTFAR